MDIIGIQEVNLKSTDDINLIKIPGYDIIYDNLIKTNNISRSAIIIKNTLNYKIRNDLTNQKDAHQAITVYITKKIKLNVHVWYRQWQEINLQGRIPNTKTTKSQKNRITETSKMFQKSIEEGETYILTDSNINTTFLNTPENQKPPMEKNNTPIMKIFQEQIINKGFTILNNENTKPNTKGESHIIDHILTSHPQLNVNTTTVKQHYSDHFMVTTNRLTKQQINTPRYTQTRPYNKIDYNTLCLNIANDPQIMLILNSTNIDEIAQGIIDLISHHLNSWAPLKTIQVKKKDSQPISEDTKTLIQRRDEAWDQYTTSKDQDTLRDYRHMKAKVNKSLKND